MKKKMSNKEWNEKLENIAVLIIIVIVSIVLIYLLIQASMENNKKQMMEFENKFKPVCEKYNKSWLESGSTFHSRCYDENNGVLIEYNIVQKGEEFYLKEK